MKRMWDAIDRLSAACGSIAVRLRSSERGNVLIETALVMPIFAMLAMGSFDIGRFAMEHARMEQASRAGAQVAIQNLAETPVLADIEAEVVSAATLAIGPDIATLTVSATITCWCSSGGTATTAATCDDPCASGEVAGKKLVVTASHMMDPVFAVAGLLEPRTISSETVLMY